jgi:hypothetical protein
MKGYDEIKRILVEELGFKDLDAYARWVEEVRPTMLPTPARVALLSPDEVDCHAFWRVCDELFGTDPVCNVTVPPEVGRLPFEVTTPMDANRMNLRLARSLGVTSFLDENAHERVKTLEIGPGFGSLKNYIETRTNHVYTGVDVVPRVPGVLAATHDGLLPRDLVEEEQGAFSYAIASNVFQHLSSRQRTQYYEDIQALLHEGALFIFNLLIDTGKLPAHTRDRKGQAWADHYGQYTPIPKAGALYDELSSHFDILYVTQRYDGLFNFACRKR